MSKGVAVTAGPSRLAAILAAPEARPAPTDATYVVAQAEADAKTAHAAGLQHQAQVRRTDAATAREDVTQEFNRADKIDPDTDPATTRRD
jgi:hypothetical protein